ncbi:hypothetical protein BGW38_004138, partial [Lunasporangiospora selenospora]
SSTTTETAVTTATATATATTTTVATTTATSASIPLLHVQEHIPAHADDLAQTNAQGPRHDWNPFNNRPRQSVPTLTPLHVNQGDLARGDLDQAVPHISAAAAAAHPLTSMNRTLAGSRVFVQADDRESSAEGESKGLRLGGSATRTTTATTTTMMNVAGLDESQEWDSSIDLEDHHDDQSLSMPFRLLLVSRDFADAAVRSLWGSLVFHGHDMGQMQALLATLMRTDCGDVAEVDDRYSGSDEPRSSCSTLKGPGVAAVDCKGAIFDARFKALKSSSRRVSLASPVASLDPHAINKVFGEQGGDGAVTTKIRDWPRSSRDPVRRFSAALERETPASGVSTDQKQGGCFFNLKKSSQQDTERIQDGSASVVGHTSSRFGNRSIWSLGGSWFSHPYHLKRPDEESGTLNPDFAPTLGPTPPGLGHASPQMLVQVLECIRERFPDQVQALDLYASERMQAAGLERTNELERLLGTGFTGLRYLRLQGGLVDNQLLGALIKGMTTPSPATFSVGMPKPCQLSQVFLGPGSVTDSVIEKLIAVAGHSLEVIAVTSCVDVGGGALASLLTRCPRLRVLGLYRSLARDKELLEGLGLDPSEIPVVSTSANLASEGSSSKCQANRRVIIAPLERLELGTAKLSTTGVAEIVKGTCGTLRYLVLEPRHFQEEFLRDVIAPLCKNLEGIYFEDREYHQPQQQQQYSSQYQHQFHRHQQHFHQRTQHQERMQSRRSTKMHWSGIGKLFGMARSRHAARSLVQAAHPQPHRGSRTSMDDTESTPSVRVSTSAPWSSAAWGRVNSQSIDSRTTVSPWLGQTSTDEWVVRGDCALWATGSFGSTTAFESGYTGYSGGIGNNSHHGSGGHLFSLTEDRRARQRGRRLLSFIRSVVPRSSLASARHATTTDNGVSSSGSSAHGGHGSIWSGLDNAVSEQSGATSAVLTPAEDCERLLEKFGITPKTVEQVLRSLDGSLKRFQAMHVDLLVKYREETLLQAGKKMGGNDDDDETTTTMVIMMTLLVLFMMTVMTTGQDKGSNNNTNNNSSERVLENVQDGVSEDYPVDALVVGEDAIITT